MPKRSRLKKNGNRMRKTRMRAEPMYHTTSKSHFMKYSVISDKLENYEVLMITKSLYKNRDELMKKYKKDPHLNNIPLKKFDALFWNMRARGILPDNMNSLAENTSFLKHLLIYRVLNAKPRFD